MSQPELWCLSPVPGQGLQEFEAHLLTGSSSPQSLLSQHSVPPTIPCKIPSENQQRQATNAATSLQSSRRGNLCLGQDVSPTLVLAFLTPGTLRASPHSRNPQHLGVAQKAKSTGKMRRKVTHGTWDTQAQACSSGCVVYKMWPGSQAIFAEALEASLGVFKVTWTCLDHNHFETGLSPSQAWPPCSPTR